MASKSWAKRPKKKSERSGREDDFDDALGNVPKEHQWIEAELARLNVQPNDPMGPLLKVVLQCSQNMGSLPELSNEVSDNLRDFKASAYDVRRNTDRLAHLLQRRLGGVHQMPVSRAMWACGVAGFVGMLLGFTTMGGLVFMAIQRDCNLQTLDCPTLQPTLKQ